jgi:acyl-CoA synthetase (NDP forming)
MLKSDLELFSKSGIKVPNYLVVKPNEEFKLFKAKKYVVKALGKNLLHKSDMGAVKVNVEKEDVPVEMRKLRNRLGKNVENFLIQEMAEKGTEVIIGAKRDEQFGDVVLFGLGGIHVELYKDVSLRLCPVTLSDAYEMIDETKASVIMKGFRGSPQIDRKMVAQLIMKVCQIMHKNPEIKEIDLNPVILYSRNYSAVDVRVIR